MPNTNTDVLQESLALKKAWLTEAKNAFPLGSRVKVVTSDIEPYIGETGVISGYDIGDIGDYPLVSVTLDVPLFTPCEMQVTRDGFYTDELVRLA